MLSVEPGLDWLAASRMASVAVVVAGAVAGAVAEVAVVVEGATVVAEKAMVIHTVSLLCCLQRSGPPWPFLAGLHSDVSRWV